MAASSDLAAAVGTAALANVCLAQALPAGWFWPAAAVEAIGVAVLVITASDGPPHWWLRARAAITAALTPTEEPEPEMEPQP